MRSSAVSSCDYVCVGVTTMALVENMDEIKRDREFKKTLIKQDMFYSLECFPNLHGRRPEFDELRDQFYLVEVGSSS